MSWTSFPLLPFYPDRFFDVIYECCCLLITGEVSNHLNYGGSLHASACRGPFLIPWIIQSHSVNSPALRALALPSASCPRLSLPSPVARYPQLLTTRLVASPSYLNVPLHFFMPPTLVGLMGFWRCLFASWFFVFFYTVAFVDRLPVHWSQLVYWVCFWSS